MKTYWSHTVGQPNLGDELTAICLERMFGLTAVRHSLASADLASVGSILGWVWENRETTRRTHELHIVGSGFMSPGTPLSPLPFLRIHSVRGYLSKNKLDRLDSTRITVGDPGLLAPEYVSASSSVTRSRVGVVLHLSKAGNAEFQEQFSHLPVEFLDIRTADVDGFVSQLASCDIILSQSLHGLILADALGVPNTWLDLGDFHPGGPYKFYDYFSTVGRSFYPRVEGIPESVADIQKASFLPDDARLRQLRADIMAAYERALESLGSSGHDGAGVSGQGSRGVQG